MKKSFRTKKLTALFLCFALLFPLCSIGAFGLELPKPKERPVIPYALRDCEETETFVRRLPGEEKDLDTIVFLAEEGKRAMYLFSEPVKYVDENGETVDKDLTLVKTDGGYTAKANDIALLLPERLFDGVSLSYNGNGFALRPTEGGEESAAELTKENTVLYPDAFGAETALRYTPVFSGFKEDILLYRNVGKSSFSFTLISDTLVPFTDEAGALFFCDRESGEPLFRADDILCHDAKDYCFTGTLTAEPAGEENTFLLTVSVDPAILDDPELAYPVTVDPSIGLSANASGKRLYDATISSSSSSCNGTGTRVSANTYSPQTYILVSFPVLHSVLNFMTGAGFTLSSAALFMTCEGKSASCTGVTSYLYTGSFWNESNVPTSTSHLSSPSVYHSVSGSGYNTRFDITTLFQSASMDVRKGVLFEANTSSPGYVDFYSTDSTIHRPYFYLDYSAPELDEIPEGAHTYVIRNQYSGNFAYIPDIPNTYPHLKQAAPNTVKEGGKDFGTVLFTIQYDDYFGCYFISNYQTQNVLVCRNEYGDDYYLGEYYDYMYGDSEAGWYIRKTNDGYFQFIPCETILFEPQMISVGISTNDGTDVGMEEYASALSAGKWSLFLAVNAKNYIQQDRKCSAASSLQVLYGLGLQGSVTGSIDTEKESNLYNQIVYGDTNGNGVYGDPGDIFYGVYDGYVVDVINEYTTTYSYSLQYWLPDNYFESLVLNSLTNGGAPILHIGNMGSSGTIPSGYLSYYIYYIFDFSHYITIAGINIANNSEMIVNDCFWDSSIPQYYKEYQNGVHIVTTSELQVARGNYPLIHYS